jgi:hypothetical protein
MAAIAHEIGAEVLPYRPRQRAEKPKPAVRAVANQRGPERCFVIHFGGHDFVTRESMAEMFLRKSGRVVVDGGSALVPLLHEGGVELLFVTPSTVVTITPA